MSHAELIIGIPGPEIEEVRRRRGTGVSARPYRQPPGKPCHSVDMRIKATRSRTG